MNYTVLQGDCIDRLKEFPDNSVDSCVTDPPYGLSKEPDINEVLSKWLAGEEYDHGHEGFMNKSWDSFVPHPDIWREVYRVLKPGGHALVFAGTRTQDLMTVSLRLAGFEVRDVIEWLYFSGMPKSHDVSKTFDRRNGRNYPDDAFRAYLKERAEAVGLTGAQVDRELGTNGMWGHYVGRSQPAFPTVDAWQRMKPLLNLDDRYDEIIYRAEAEREKIGEREKLESYQYKGNNVYQTGGDKDRVVIDITAPATELARKWDGWGTSLKPAHEPIIVVRKPLIDADTGRKLTVADCVEKYGTGAINIDGCRIKGDLDDGLTRDRRTGTTGTVGDFGFLKPENGGGKFTKASGDKGRFPANAITTVDDAFYSKYFNVTANAVPNVTPAELSKKASKKDRNSDWQGEDISKEAITWEGVNLTEELEELNRLRKVISEDITQGTGKHVWSTLLFGKNITEEKFRKAIKSTIPTELSTTTESKTCDLLTLLLTNEYTPAVIRTIMANGLNLAENAENINRLKQSITNEKMEYLLGVASAVLETLLKIKEKGKLGNVHSTVKPVDLMAWLVRLVTPIGGIVLDPFAGSGSTLVAAKREGFGFIGIEREPEYVEIIEARTGEEAIN